jgi:uncharacterized protein (TIGR02271 family)
MGTPATPIDRRQLHEGMLVFSGEGQRLGPVERIDAGSVTVMEQQYEFSSIERLEGDRVYLTREVGASPDRGAWHPGTSGAQAPTEGGAERRVPVREEQLHVEKRPADVGEVQVRKQVVTEQQTVPVELRREEVHVKQHDVVERPLAEGELAGVFEEGTIRVPMRGEEAVARKEVVVTGEVVIDKTRRAETQRVTDTVRKEQVQVDEHYDEARDAYRREYAQRPGATGQSFEEVEPHFRTGYGAAGDRRNAGKSFEEIEPQLRHRTGAADDDAWERIKQQVREGFTRARQR